MMTPQAAPVDPDSAALLAARAENSALQAMIAQLREANEHLVLATVSAQTQQDEAEAANRRQNEFLAMLAHELRNPLAPISTAAAILERVPDANAELSQLRTIISRQVEHMARLLDDLLDAARISSGKITLERQALHLAEVIERAVEVAQPRIAERRQQLHVHAAAAPLALHGDRVRLTQVLSNLLGNASKYTPDGGEIHLLAELVEDQVAITVRDNGTGITAEVLPHIFDLFTQGPRSLDRAEGGLGIGLNVVRNLVQMHGGQVSAHSAGAGSGSTFTVTLPAAAGPAPAAPPLQPAAAAPAARRVLLVEDNRDAAETLAAFLALDQHAVDIAYDGHGGLALAQRGGYEIIICDIGLPGLDGLQLMRALRASPEGARPYTIALSGYGQDADRARALAAGFNHYLVKPVSPGALLAALAANAVLAHLQAV
ncbi:hybrid sensor histidine kinase/response regulator [Massilia sp. SM-13]|uniref:hybrid sensor histidine kinase/response regulator n=1 Tax=Pseudoduganella rhizocola TaxID=3382643 RepID=UPI0038B65AA8